MGTQSLRIRLVFEDRSILSKTQRSDGMNHSWLLLKPPQHPTISDVCKHLLRIFKLRRSCPTGILLSMEGFTLPSFESTEILKDKEIICVKKKGSKTPVAGNDEVEDNKLQDNGLLLLENNNNNLDKAGDYSSESEEVDEEVPKEAASKKRKASTNLQNLKKKKRCVTVLDDDEDEAETEEIGNISSKKGTITKDAKTNKKVNSSTIVKRSEDLQENPEEVNPVAKKAPSRSSRRKMAKRKLMKEYAKIAKKKPQYSKPEVIKRKNDEDDGQPKGLLYWKENGDAGPVVTRPRHIRFESLDEDQAAKHIRVSNETFKRSGSSAKRKGQKWVRENFINLRKKEESKRLNKEIFKTLFKDSQVPVIDINDFDKLPPCSEPKEGDVIAYRLLELNSSWIPEFSSFRVGRISYYDAKDIVLIPVAEYPIAPEQSRDNGPNDSLYGEDGSLEINYSALVDVRNILQHDPDAMKKVNNNPEGEVSPWDRFSSKNMEIPEPNYSGLSPCSYGGPGPSTSTSPDAAESSGVKEGQNGNSSDPWLAANKPDDVEKTAPAENDCENGNSWGRPWSTFVVSKGSSVIQQDWRAGSSRGSGKPWSRGAPRGRGRGGGRGRGRNG